MVKGITYILKEDTGVKALVGLNKTGAKYKAYPGVCPEPEKVPYSVVKQTGKVPVECKGMAPNEYDYSYDVLSFTESYDASEALDAAVVAALSKPNGGTFNSVNFSDIRHTNTRDEIFQTQGGTVLFIKISSFDAKVDI
jgi:hypothetical protein